MHSPDDVASVPPHSTPAPSRRVLVVLVGLRPRAEAAFRAAIHGDDDFALALSEDLTSARHLVESRPERAVILVCEAALLEKRLDLPPNMSLWAVSGPERTSPKELGVDQIVSRPIDPDDLRARLQIAARALTAGARVAPGDALNGAIEAGSSGEVVIHRGTDFARVLLRAGRIAWVHRSGYRTSIRDLLGACGVTLDEAAVREVLEECRRSRRHFGDVLVEWDIVAPDRLREALRRHLEAALADVLEWREATALFVHEDRPATSSLTFTAAEVMASAPRRPRVHTYQGMPAVSAAIDERDDAAVDRWLERVSKLPNVLGCALLDPRSGTVLGSRGAQDMTDNLVWGLVAAFSSLGAGKEELLATLKTTAYLVRSSVLQSRAVAVVCFDPRELSLAMARIVIAKTENELQ
jgi:hypothetical protein